MYNFKIDHKLPTPPERASYAPPPLTRTFKASTLAEGSMGSKLLNFPDSFSPTVIFFLVPHPGTRRSINTQNNGFSRRIEPIISLIIISCPKISFLTGENCFEIELFRWFAGNNLNFSSPFAWYSHGFPASGLARAGTRRGTATGKQDCQGTDQSQWQKKISNFNQYTEVFVLVYFL